jgi:hypothetical protein
MSEMVRKGTNSGMIIRKEYLQENVIAFEKSVMLTEKGGKVTSIALVKLILGGLDKEKKKEMLVAFPDTGARDDAFEELVDMFEGATEKQTLRLKCLYMNQA